MGDAWEEAYTTRFGQSKFGDDAIGLFALGLQFAFDDLDTLGNEIVTGGNDDKKCDLLYFDKEENRCIVAQCLIGRSKKASAPANKASDLNTAIAWLFSSPLNKLPARLKPTAEELREAIHAGSLREIYIWYVHNLPESANVRNELLAVEHAADAAVKKLNAASTVRIMGREIGAETLQALYLSSESPILVTDEFDFAVPDGFKISGKNWSAFQTSLPGRTLFELYQKHGTELFSANIRDYLGSRLSDSNINNGIKATAESEPDNFWVFNNGVTALVNSLTPRKLKKGYRLKAKGLSIVNGAQTTGAIGSLDTKPAPKLTVPIRFIWTRDEELVENIIKYNNSQNKISASDFISNDAIQKRLKDEFKVIPDAEYEGGRRGGASDTIKRRPNALPSYTVGQALAAFHGDPATAYNRKSEIWVDDQSYSRYFNQQTTAKHIVLVYSLFKAIGKKKMALVEKSRSGDSLTGIEQDQLSFMEKKGALLLICAAMADCLETVVGRAIPNKFRLSFGEKVSPKAAEELWIEVLDPLLALVTVLNSAFSNNRITAELVKSAIPAFRNVAASVSGANKSVYKRFASKVKVD